MTKIEASDVTRSSRTKMKNPQREWLRAVAQSTQDTGEVYEDLRLSSCAKAILLKNCRWSDWGGGEPLAAPRGVSDASRRCK
jgi:hypothetical protein